MRRSMDCFIFFVFLVHLALESMFSRASWILLTDSGPVVTAMSAVRVLQKWRVSRKFFLVPNARYLSFSCLQTAVLSRCVTSMCWELTSPVSQLKTFPPLASPVQRDQAWRHTALDQRIYSGKLNQRYLVRSQKERVYYEVESGAWRVSRSKYLSQIWTSVTEPFKQCSEMCTTPEVDMSYLPWKDLKKSKKILISRLDVKYPPLFCQGD